jgi:hypothetical protein
MIYFSGAISKKIDEVASKDIGFLYTPQKHNTVTSTRPWCVDTGCFSSKFTFNADVYLAYLHKWKHLRASCAFATAPDVIGNWLETLSASKPMFQPIWELGYKVALVAQDGLVNTMIPWLEIDAIFIGGTTDWKLSLQSAAICREARRRDKWVHIGRVNTLKRIAFAKFVCQADSVDGNTIAFAPSVNLPKVENWLQQCELQTTWQV